jgi:hypothetical protein
MKLFSDEMIRKCVMDEAEQNSVYAGKCPHCQTNFTLKVEVAGMLISSCCSCTNIFVTEL